MQPGKRAPFATAGVVALLAVACGSNSKSGSAGGATATTAASSGNVSGAIAAAQANAAKFASVPTVLVWSPIRESTRLRSPAPSTPAVGSRRPPRPG